MRIADRITVALIGMLGLICVATLLAVATDTLTVKEATDLFLLVGSPIIGITGFAVGVTLVRR